MPARLVAGPPAQRSVELRGQSRQIRLRRRLARVDDLLAQEIAFEQEDQEHLLGLERDKVQVLDPRQCALRRARDRGVLGDRRHRHRNSLDHALDVAGRGLQLVVDVRPDAVRDRFQVHQEVDEVAIPGVGGHPSRRGVWLGQIAEVRQLGELAADGG